MATAPEIPLDIRENLHDCILAVFWPKKKILEFLLSVGCPANLVPPPETELSRHMIVTDVFSKLSRRADRGYVIFQEIIDRMYNWSYFDPYWFDTQQKLVRSQADSALNKLRAAIDSRNSTTRNRRDSAKKGQAKQRNGADLSALSNAFSKMFGSGMTVQARGKLFEQFLQILFDKQSIQMGDSFRIVGEEIDGSFKFEGENYIVEAKWQDKGSSTEQLYKFAYKVDGKMYGRGVFISVNGYSWESLSAIVHGKHLQTILIDGEDISFVLEGRTRLEQLLDYKIRAAQTKGEIYVCAVRGCSKPV